MDFNHKGHKGIYRPSYYGDINAAPTQFFEYWEPKLLGYMRKDFPKSNNPYANFLGNGCIIDRGGWESSLGIIGGSRFGDYIGSGSEQTVFKDNFNYNNVLKVYTDTRLEGMQALKDMVYKFEQRRNTIPLQEPVNFIGTIDLGGYPYPVFTQNKISPLNISYNEFEQKVLPELREMLQQYGFNGDGISSNFTKGNTTLIDLKPENMGYTVDGKLKFIDVDLIKKR